MPYYDYLWLSQYEIDFLSNNGAEAVVVMPEIVWHLFMLSWVASSIGLFFFINFARKAFIALVIFTALLNPFLGWQVFSPFDAAVVSILNMIDGALIVMAYFTSISVNFNKHLTSSSSVTNNP